MWERGVGEECVPRRSRGLCEKVLYYLVCFTICLFISPDFDGYRAYIDSARPHLGERIGQCNALEMPGCPWSIIIV